MKCEDHARKIRCEFVQVAESGYVIPTVHTKERDTHRMHGREGVVGRRRHLLNSLYGFSANHFSAS